MPKVSRQDAKLLEAVQTYLPRIGFSDELGKALKILIGREIGPTFSFQRDHMAAVNIPQKLQGLTRQGIYLLFGLPPLDAKGVLEIDPLIAHMAIDKLLGGAGEPLTMIRPLTEIEEGVLSFLFLKIFSLIFDRCGKQARVHFRMEGFRSSPEELAPFFKNQPDGIYFSFHLSLGNRAGYARLILPGPMAQKAFLEPLEGASPTGDRETEYYGARLANLGFVQTDVWTELGRTALKVADINRLEPGDVILLERTQARIQKGRLSGAVSVRVGRGERGSFRGEIVPSPDGLQVKLTAVDLEQQV
ncbi:MAG TPA: FliM/FliN family flagellar motor switch protein [bacterium]|nr:FliM/FliN family flagellar motor switch protein [bacterium]